MSENAVIGKPSFPERIPRNAYEEQLVAIQAKADPVGQELYAMRVENPKQTAEWRRLLQLSRMAKTVVAEAFGMEQKTRLWARYAYQVYNNPAFPGKLHYPLDTIYYVAYVVGHVEGVSPSVVQLPSLDREKKYSYRVCANVSAARLLHDYAPDRLGGVYDVRLPVGELYTEPVSLEDGLAEALEPIKPPGLYK